MGYNYDNSQKNYVTITSKKYLKNPFHKKNLSKFSIKFDNVHHRGLFYKLKHYGIHSHLNGLCFFSQTELSLCYQSHNRIFRQVFTKEEILKLHMVFFPHKIVQRNMLHIVVIACPKMKSM